MRRQRPAFRSIARIQVVTVSFNIHTAFLMVVLAHVIIYVRRAAGAAAAVSKYMNAPAGAA